MRKTSAAGLGLALLIAAGATAQVRQDVREKGTAKTTTPAVRKVSAIMGGEVRLRDGALGKVTDIVISESGCIDYLVVRDGEGYVAVPWGAVRYEAGAKSITVTAAVTRDKLKGIRFRTSDWPDFYSERWMRSAGEVWGEKALRRPPVRDDTRRNDKRDDKRRDEQRDDIRRDDSRNDKRDDKRRDEQRDDVRRDDSRNDKRDDKRRDEQRDPRRDDLDRGDDKRPPVKPPPGPDRP
jgi:hypothetical protein